MLLFSRGVRAPQARVGVVRLERISAFLLFESGAIVTVRLREIYIKLLGTGAADDDLLLFFGTSLMNNHV